MKESTTGTLNRLATLGYGLFSYGVFLGTFVYLIGFVSGYFVPKSLSSGSPDNPGFAVVIDALLLSLFAAQHNVMARPEFKKWWTRIIPASAERSTYVLLSSLTLILLFIFWAPLPTVIWQLEQSVGIWLVNAAAALGWLVVLLSTFLINHFDLFGLRQVYGRFTGTDQSSRPFKTTGLYKYVRHPLMLGFLIAFWATPTMTLGHLLFAGFLTLWVLASIQLEERDLEAFHGEIYRVYKKRVPMLLPVKGPSGATLDSPSPSSPSPAGRTSE